MHQKSKRSIALGTLYTHEGVVGDETEIDAAHITDDSAIAGRFIVIEGSLIERVHVGDCPNLRLTRCELRTVDAANADIENAGWRDLRISDSRFTGARLNNAVMSKVSFTQSRMEMMQLQNAKLKGVRFEQCDLRGAFFNGTNMPGTILEGSNLTGADFSTANITGSDLRRAIIEDIRIAPDQLTKVIVSSDQAIYLARLFGLDVRE
ncbi:MAG: pentapeptide repeat-containing protein [Thermomicrobiales bacterium]|nr:pentapeptide repeat-containing protein [Thermomicrobiales bacterium]